MTEQYSELCVWVQGISVCLLRVCVSCVCVRARARARARSSVRACVCVCTCLCAYHVCALVQMYVFVCLSVRAGAIGW